MLKFGTTTIALAGWLPGDGDPRGRRMKAVRKIVEGYRLPAVELTLDLAALYPQFFDEEFYRGLAKYQQQKGFTCSVHLPFLWVDIASLNEILRKASVETLLQAVELTRPLEVWSYVLHPWGPISAQALGALRRGQEGLPAEAILLGQARRSLEELGEAVDLSKVCLETVESTEFEVALPLVEGMGTSICLDTGHLAVNGDVLDFLFHHGERVRVVHLHDVRQGPGGRHRDHLPLGEGDLDYAVVIERLQGMHFEGVVILENNNRGDLERSLEKLAPYRPS